MFGQLPYQDPRMAEMRKRQGMFAAQARPQQPQMGMGQIPIDQILAALSGAGFNPNSGIAGPFGGPSPEAMQQLIPQMPMEAEPLVPPVPAPAANVLAAPAVAKPTALKKTAFANKKADTAKKAGTAAKAPAMSIVPKPSIAAKPAAKPTAKSVLSQQQSLKQNQQQKRNIIPR